MTRTAALGTLTALTVLLFAAHTRAQATRPQMRAQARGETPITIDGVLDEAPWVAADVGSNFVERLPTPDARPPVDTEVRMLFDDDAVYVGVTMHLLPGEVPYGLTYQRDSFRLWDDDAVTLKFDVRHDHRTTAGFATNVLGTQLDYISVDNGRSFRLEYDAVWEVATHVNEDTWVAEFRIPGESLGLSPNESLRTIGFDASRDHNARLATDDWSLIPPEFGSTSAIHYGEVTGLSGIGGGRVLSLVPFAAGAYRRTPEAGNDFTPTAGGDIRLRLAEDVWGEATILTDFAEVDLDAATINLTRFPLFLPEKRPFFLSGADVFEFGESGVSQLYFSRRIGLDSQGGTVPILGGIKTYGRVGNTSFGLLDVATEATANAPSSNVNILRLRQNIGESSFLGAMLAMREYLPVSGGGRTAPFTPDPHVSVGIDGLGRFFEDRLALTGYAALTQHNGAPLDPMDPMRTGDGSSGRLALSWMGKQWTPSISTLYVSDEFRPELGFVRRRGVLQTHVEIPYLRRFPTGPFRAYQLTAAGEVTSTDEGDANLGMWGQWKALLLTRNRWQFIAGAEFQSDRVERPFTLIPGIDIAEGTYRGASMFAEIDSPAGRNPTMSAYYEVANSYFGGTRHYLYADATLSFGPHVRIVASTTQAWIRLPEHAPIHTATVNSTLTLALNPRLATDFVFQMNSIAKLAVAYARLRWRFQPGSDIFLVYREDLDFSGEQLSSINRSVTLKASYRFDLVL